MPTSVFSPTALAGRTALITGGGSGIGFAIASALAGAGANLVLASRNLDRLQTAADTIRGKGDQAVLVVADAESPPKNCDPASI